jgi:hypothetical protein
MSDHDHPVAANVLNQEFTADAQINGGSAIRRNASSGGTAASSTWPPSSTCSHASWSAGR